MTSCVCLCVTDDDNRVKLKPITDLPDYQHDYVNASPVNVSVSVADSRGGMGGRGLRVGVRENEMNMTFPPATGRIPTLSNNFVMRENAGNSREMLC